jgi:hypothetical protein
MMPMSSMLKKEMIPLGSGLFQEKRLFSDAMIQNHIDEALKSVEGDGAVLDVRIDNTKVAAVLAARIHDNWTIGLMIEREHTGEFTAGAKVVFDW